MQVALNPVSQHSFACSTVPSTQLCDLQHFRLGHLSQGYLETMDRSSSVIGLCLNTSSRRQCTTCVQSKSHRLPFSSTRPRATHFLQNFHVDLSGINRVKGLFGEHYYIIFVDDYSCFSFIFPLNNKTKESVFSVFLE